MFVTRRLRISVANIGPNRFHQNRIVSWLISIPRFGQQILDVAQRQRVTTRRMTSGELLKYLNEFLIA